jgi:hypothetical protein
MREKVIVPLTDEEYLNLKNTIASIGNHLPENLAPYIWDLFNRLRGENENRPCTCGSAGAHWGRAVKYLRDYIKEKEIV